MAVNQAPLENQAVLTELLAVLAVSTWCPMRSSATSGPLINTYSPLSMEAERELCHTTLETINYRIREAFYTVVMKKVVRITSNELERNRNWQNSKTTTICSIKSTIKDTIDSILTEDPWTSTWANGASNTKLETNIGPQLPLCNSINCMKPAHSSAQPLLAHTPEETQVYRHSIPTETIVMVLFRLQV